MSVCLILEFDHKISCPVWKFPSTASDYCWERSWMYPKIWIGCCMLARLWWTWNLFTSFASMQIYALTRDTWAQLGEVHISVFEALFLWACHHLSEQSSMWDILPLKCYKWNWVNLDTLADWQCPWFSQEYPWFSQEYILCRHSSMWHRWFLSASTACLRLPPINVKLQFIGEEL